MRQTEQVKYEVSAQSRTGLYNAAESAARRYLELGAFEPWPTNAEMQLEVSAAAVAGDGSIISWQADVTVRIT